jgi:hypothetical protein
LHSIYLSARGDLATRLAYDISSKNIFNIVCEFILDSIRDGFLFVFFFC